MSILTDADRELLPLALRQRGGFHVATKWYFNGWEPLWYQYLFHQTTQPFKDVVPNVTFIAGIACVRGDTPILDPISGHGTPIADLAARGEPIRVLSWDGEKFVVANANPPFHKGRADLFQVTLKDGRKIVTTREHRFLTPHGYVALKELRAGCQIGVVASQGLPTRGEDGRHCSQKAPDCPGRYWTYPRQYGGPLPMAQGNDPTSSPLPAYANGCIHDDHYKDERLLPKYTHLHRLSTPHSTWDFLHQPVRLAFAASPHDKRETFVPVLDLRQSLGQSPRSSFLCEPYPGFDPSVDRAGLVVSPGSPLLDTATSPSLTCGGYQVMYSSGYQGFQQSGSNYRTEHKALQDVLWSGMTNHDGSPCDASYNGVFNCSTKVLFLEIVKIDYDAYDDFYDMHVPVYENYVANGIINHNTGKTTAVAASYLIDCITIPHFRALNTSVTAKQAELPFEMVQGWIEANPKLEHLVDTINLRPYPTITFKNRSEWIFRTAGQDARFIRGMEFDRINYDEAGLDATGEAVKVLRGRLRGNRPDGRNRMIRLDVTTSPTASPWLEERFNRGWKESPEFDPASYLSLRISTYMNTKLTAQMIHLMEAEYSDDMIDVELKGMFPDYGLSLFPRTHVAACTDQSLNDAAELALRPETGRAKAGYVVEEHPRYGITRFELPADPAHIYIMAGDPGTDSPPRRNAPCVAVMDITEKPNKVVYFDWVDGKGSYNPFLFSYKYALAKYRPVLRGMDTTGTQKAIDEIAFENVGISVDGLNFNRDKEAMLNSLSQAVTNHEMKWPVIKGIQRQMQSYSRENDKKIPQDIVMTLAQLAFLERHAPEIEPSLGRPKRGNIYNRNQRTTAVPRRRV